MNLTYRPLVTVADVLDACACIEGVVEWVEAHGGRISGPPSDYPGNEDIQHAARADGYGYGYGYGDGHGDGNGFGYGYGDGNGFGDGYGDGDGYGFGDCDPEAVPGHS